ncbi:MAG: hypothetical protein RLZZ444_4345 [Pseudomonadota bacterium]
MSKLFQSMQAKVIAIFLGMVFLSVCALAILSYSSSDRIFLDQTKEAMQSVLTFRAANLENEFDIIQDQATSIAKIEALGKAMVNLKSGWKSLDKTPGAAKAELQKFFVTGNPNPADEREKLLKPEGPGGYYYSAHEELQPELAKLLPATHFSDMLMLDGKGNVIYSYKKLENFGENATAPEFAQTSLGKVFAQTTANVAKAQTDDVAAVFSGLSVNATTGRSDIFVAIPLVNLGQLRGIFIFQVRDDAIGKIMTMGITKDSSAKTSIISADGTVISTDTAGKLVALDPAAFTFRDAAFADSAMTVAQYDRTDGAATSFNMPVSVGAERFLIAESILDSELASGSLQIATLLAAAGAVVLIITSVISGFVLRRMLAPLGQLAKATEAVASGALDTRIEGESRHDEIGTMSRALAGFRSSLVTQRELEAQTATLRAADEKERQARADQQRAESDSLQSVVSMLGEGLNRLARGDLAYQIHQSFPPALDGLRLNFNASVEQLANALTAISHNSNAVKAGTEEMRSSADQLAERTERQSAAISETASAISHITEAVRQQMARAEQATKIAKDANDGTRASAQIMEQTIKAMEAIQTSSQQINSIVSVIDEIAFQTNLLALNAGVEAARAGESGKGFAVVAQEVRELAQRSARAAKEISDLLTKSTAEVDTGVSLVEKAGQALQAIGTHVESINHHIVGMMESTREEAETLRNINSSVSQIESMTQQNAAMVEETTASTHQLAQEAGEMNGRIGQFQFAHSEPVAWRRSA